MKPAFELPDDWFVENDGQRLVLDPEKVKAALEARVALQGWRTFEDRPEPGRKFVALYNDGSGATMFCAFYGGVIDSDGDEYYGWNPDDASYDLWAYLPDTMNFWCEVRAEDPVLLSQPPAASDREERR